MGFSLGQLKEKNDGGRDLTFSRNTILNYSHENVSAEFENLDITEAYTLLVLNQGENYGIDEIIDISECS